MIDFILNREGKVKDLNELMGTKKPLNYEIVELRRTPISFILSYSDEGRGLDSGLLEKTRRSLYVYNLYGRTITKKPKGWYFLLWIAKCKPKTNGRDLANLKIKAEFIGMDENWLYNSKDSPRIVREIIKMLYLQFT